MEGAEETSTPQIEPINAESLDAFEAMLEPASTTTTTIITADRAEGQTANNNNNSVNGSISQPPIAQQRQQNPNRASDDTNPNQSTLTQDTTTQLIDEPANIPNAPTSGTSTSSTFEMD